MKFLKSIWTVVGLSLLLSTVLLFVLMQSAIEKIRQEQHASHVPNLDPVPDKPIQYPDNLTDEIKAFVTELERRDELIRERERGLQSIRDSIRQEKKEFENHRQKILTLQAEFDGKVQEFRENKIYLEQKKIDQMKDLAATVEGLSPAAAVSLFLQMSKDEFERQREEEPEKEFPIPNMPDPVILGILELMDPKDIAPIFEELTGGKEATEESKALAASLTQSLQRLVVETEEDAQGGNGG